MTTTQYTKNFQITLDMVGYDKKITPKYIMQMFQSVATENAEELGFGFKDLSPYNQAWVINKIKVIYIKNIKVGDTITFTTWPLAPKHYTAERDFEAYNQDGEKVLIGTSMWSIIDLEKRCLCTTDKIKNTKINYPIKRAVKNTEISRFSFDENFEKKFSKRIKISDLDVNNHVNNTNYVTYVIDCMTKTDYSKGISSFEIKFQQELVFGDQIEFFYKKAENKHYVIGKKINGQDTIFSCLLETK